jgi:hypothetical protein
MTWLKAAYLENPHDAKVAAHIGFLHIWRLSERRRLETIPPQITDDAVLARKYFGGRYGSTPMMPVSLASIAPC